MTSVVATLPSVVAILHSVVATLPSVVAILLSVVATLSSVVFNLLFLQKHMHSKILLYQIWRQQQERQMQI